MLPAPSNLRAAIAALCCLCAVARAGKLDSFEESVSKPRRRTHEKSCGHNADSSGNILSDIAGAFFAPIFEAMCRGVGHVIVDGLWSGVVEYGGTASLARTMRSPVMCGGRQATCREYGEPLIPFARVDVSYQSVNGDVDAVDWRIEAGYAMLSLCFEHSRYREREPDDTLDLSKIWLMYRMSFGPYTELGMGFGNLSISGNERHVKGAFTMPLRLHGRHNLGLEFRPSWADNFAEYDIGVFLRRKYCSLKAGYRRAESPGETLAGPYCGFAIHY